MSAADDSPHSWHDLYEEAVDIASTPSKSKEGPGGVGHSAQRTPERPPPSVRAIVVNNDVSLVCVKTVPGVEVCGGKIGSSQKFCTMSLIAEDQGSCQYASHVTKASIPTPAYFIRAGKGHAAFCEPCLPVPSEGFPDQVMVALRGQRSTSEWTKLFPILSAAANLPAEQMMDLIARGERNVTVGPTPAKRRIWIDDSDDGSDLENLDESQVFTQFFQEAKLPEGPEIKSRDKVMHIVSQWNDLLVSTECYRTIIKDFDLAARASMEEIDDKVVQVASMLGTRPANDLPLTAWSAISAIVDGSTDYKKEVDAKLDVMVEKVIEMRGTIDNQIGPTVKLLSNTVKRLQASPTIASEAPTSDREAVLTRELQDLAKAHRELTKKHQEALVDMDDLKSGMLNMKVAFEELRMDRSVGQQFDQLEYRRAMEDMRNQIHQVRRHVDTASASAPHPNRDEASVMEEMASLRDAVASMSIEMTNLKSEIISDSVSFGGHHFMSQDSYLLFITQHCPKGQVQFMLDFVSFMECATNRNKNSTDQLRVMKSVLGAGFKDQGTNYATVFASFGTLIPALFGTEFDVSDPSKKMGSMKNMKEWDPMTERHGRKSTINTAVTALRRSMELQLVSTFGQSSVAYFFFTNMLHSTCAFWDALSAWITRFENEMVSQSSVNASPAIKASVWNLICWMLHSMFTEFEVCRAPGMVAQDLDPSNTAEIASAILEGTLKAHKLMKELMDNHFNRHPIFTATLGEFLMTSKATTISVQELEVTVKANAVALRAAQSSNDKKQAAGKKQDN